MDNISQHTLTEIHTKVQKEIDDCMTSAREYAVTIDQARQYEKQAQDIARIYNLPIPELSDNDIYIKAEEEMEEYIRIARQYSTNVGQAKEYEKRAQNIAKKYNILIPEFSDIEIHIKAKVEVENYMRKAYYDTFTMDEARYYEKKAQDIAKTHDLPIPELSNHDIEILRQRETEAEE
jgi:RNase P subunit RPR2